MPNTFQLFAITGINDYNIYYRDKWKSYPVSTIAYQRFIELSEREKLSNELSKILPPVLILVDDFQPTYVVRGLKILQRILLVVPAADMR